MRPVNEPVSLSQTEVYPRFLPIVCKRSRDRRPHDAWPATTRDGAADDGNASGKDTVRKCRVCNRVVVVPRHFRRDAAHRGDIGEWDEAGFRHGPTRAFVREHLFV